MRTTVLIRKCKDEFSPIESVLSCVDYNYFIPPVRRLPWKASEGFFVLFTGMVVLYRHKEPKFRRWLTERTDGLPITCGPRSGPSGALACYATQPRIGDFLGL